MKRLPVVLVLTVIAVAAAAAPAYANRDPQGAGYVSTAAASPQAGLAAAAPAASHAAAHISRAGSIGSTAAQTAGTQAAAIHGRDMSVRLPSTGRGAPGVAIAAVLALVVAGAVVALVADRRRSLPGASASKPVRIGGHKVADQHRRAA
jgi:ABC-type dipeptide/oligopeptide/nickel transport system permease subunit